jgi:hypothetical protein
VALLALIAGTVPYLHMHRLVALHGPRWVASLTPLSVDGMSVAASATLLAGEFAEITRNPEPSDHRRVKEPSEYAGVRSASQGPLGVRRGRLGQQPRPVCETVVSSADGGYELMLVTA